MVEKPSTLAATLPDRVGLNQPIATEYRAVTRNPGRCVDESLDRNSSASFLFTEPVNQNARRFDLKSRQQGDVSAKNDAPRGEALWAGSLTALGM
jgi:hypothetical protein